MESATSEVIRRTSALSDRNSEKPLKRSMAAANLSSSRPLAIAEVEPADVKRKGSLEMIKNIFRQV